MKEKFDNSQVVLRMGSTLPSLRYDQIDGRVYATLPSGIRLRFTKRLASQLGFTKRNLPNREESKSVQRSQKMSDIHYGFDSLWNVF